MSELVQSSYEVLQSPGDPYERDAPEVWEIVCHEDHEGAPGAHKVFSLSSEIVFKNLTMEDLNRAMQEHHERFHA